MAAKRSARQSIEAEAALEPIETEEEKEARLTRERKAAREQVGGTNVGSTNQQSLC